MLLALGVAALVAAGAALAGGDERARADTTAPETRIARGPGATVWAPRARFRLAASERGARFACSLDGGAWRRCAALVTFGGLDVGWHELRVRATDRAGNRDATPAVRRWRYQPRVG